jgi:hypothetical protein
MGYKKMKKAEFYADSKLVEICSKYVKGAQA